MTSPSLPDERARLMADTIEVASRLLETRLRTVGDPFPGSRRTLVVRVTDDDGNAYVVKRYVGQEGAETYAREAAAL
ncbi:MAG: hypothetical protein ACKOVB_17410, partial [Terrabacter sp.]